MCVRAAPPGQWVYFPVSTFRVSTLFETGQTVKAIRGRSDRKGSHMKRLLPVLVLLALPAMACNLSESPTPIPTVPPAPPLQNPIVGLSPVSGPPGTVIRVAAAGFPTGSTVNLYLSGIDATTTPNPVAQGLNIGAGGVLTFALQLPNEVDGKTLSGTTPLNFTVSTADNLTRASAVFVATAGGTSATATPAPSDNSAGGGTAGGQLFITGPAIGSVAVGGTLVVTGSGSAFNNRVGVQLLDASNNILGSNFAIIQATAGAIGPWQTTIAFAQPASPTVGYIVAYTVNAAGAVADRASIPVSLAGAGVPTITPTTSVATSVPPTVLPVITVGPTSAQPTTSFITATPR